MTEKLSRAEKTQLRKDAEALIGGMKILNDSFSPFTELGMAVAEGVYEEIQTIRPYADFVRNKKEFSQNLPLAEVIINATPKKKREKYDQLAQEINTLIGNEMGIGENKNRIQELIAEADALIREKKSS